MKSDWANTEKDISESTTADNHLFIFKNTKAVYNYLLKLTNMCIADEHGNHNEDTKTYQYKP
jgi:hypothetical protein